MQWEGLAYLSLVFYGMVQTFNEVHSKQLELVWGFLVISVVTGAFGAAAALAPAPFMAQKEDVFLRNLLENDLYLRSSNT